MIRMSLAEIAAALGCETPAGETTVDRVVTDSRKVEYGSLFAALPGSQVDGHDFAGAAAKLGAAALLVNRPLDIDLPQLVVDDVLKALGRLASHLRRKIDPVVVGITGSNGKTTVKEMVASILVQSGDVLSTQGNFNNELGLPLSLFGLEERHRYAVLEMGASRAGDIAYLAGIAAPDVGLITNIGPAHLRGFGSEEGVALAKGELYASLPEAGCAVMNADEPWLPRWRELNTAGRLLTFGVSAHADVRLVDENGESRLETPAGPIELRLALPGRHNRINAAAAAAVAIELGVDSAAIRTGLAAVKPVPGRLNLLRTQPGWTVIDDTYNANPASLYSALRVLSDLQGTAWLVLGDMKELGGGSHKMHREVGEAAKVMGVARLFATGEMTLYTVDSFGEGAEHFDSRDALIAALLEQLRPGVNCLVKGSRSMGMEAVVEAIARRPGMREAS
jgi:UDP-N-acetylmuramoyl-tripeptide--D-alanyl-D-alanine ligase